MAKTKFSWQNRKSPGKDETLMAYEKWSRQMRNFPSKKKLSQQRRNSSDKVETVPVYRCFDAVVVLACSRRVWGGQWMFY